VVREKTFTIAGATGREFEAETTQPSGYVSGRVFIINGRFYELLAMGTHARLASAETQTFLKSFKLTK
jgi:hypothetical protein